MNIARGFCSSLIYFLALFTISADCAAALVPQSMYKFSIAAIFSQADLYNGEIEISSGSGFVISENGDILTALHVVGNPELYEKLDLKVYFPVQNGRSWTFNGPFAGKIVATLLDYDLAVIKLADPSFASSLPILALNFDSPINDDDEFVGYGYNTLTNPQRPMQPFRISAKYSSSANNLPYDIVQESSLNPGASGGPLLRLDKRVAAIWHGRFASFLGLNGKYSPVEGLSWIIPMDTVVAEWLAKNKIPVKSTPPEYNSIKFSTQTSNLAVDAKTLMKIQKTSDSGKVSSVYSPLGTEIVSINASENVNRLECTSDHECFSVMGQENIALDASIYSGRVAYLKPIKKEISGINIVLKEAVPPEDFEFQTVSFTVNANPSSKNTSVTFPLPVGKRIVAGEIVFTEGMPALDYTFNDNGVLISTGKFSRKLAGSNSGIDYPSSDGAGYQKWQLSGTAIIMFGNGKVTTQDKNNLRDIKEFLDMEQRNSN
ncbi:hypothetical protein OKW12_001947 [Pseudomonas silensiensis]|nr:hypothetical protein [Pseudomonas silensiensis]